MDEVQKTTYFCTWTLMWPGSKGAPATWGDSITFTTDEVPTRSGMLAEIRAMGEEDGTVPADADVLFFSLERDEVAGAWPCLGSLAKPSADVFTAEAGEVR